MRDAIKKHSAIKANSILLFLMSWIPSVNVEHTASNVYVTVYKIISQLNSLLRWMSSNHLIVLAWPKSSTTLGGKFVFIITHFCEFFLCFMHNFCCFCAYRVLGSSLSSKFHVTLDKIELRVLIRYCWNR